MKWTDLKQRLMRLDPLVIDSAMAVGLAALVCLQIWAFEHVRPDRFPLPPGAMMMLRMRPDYGLLPYFLAAGCFLPLALRRRIPWLALVLSTGFAVAYYLPRMPQAFTMLGPIIALYSLTAHARRRHVGLMSLAVIGLFLAVLAFAFSENARWLADAVGTFALIVAAAFLGESARSRRDYIAEVEARAVEAERSRDEEALRRVDEERMRIAREVHDIVAHSLSIVTVQAAAAEALLDTDVACARESIRTVRATGKDALGELRSMLDVLRTGEEAPLAPAAELSHIEQLITPVREAGIDVVLEADGDLRAVPAFVSVSAYRVVQEALTNAVRHSGAHRVLIAFRLTERRLEFEITDDGRGATDAEIANGGHGLRGMRERVEVLGGTFESGSGREGGFRVFASIPLPRSGV